MRRKTRIYWKHWGIGVFKWGAVPVLIVVGARLAWGWAAWHRLGRAEGALRAKHLWLDEAQLRGTPVPKGQNAVTALLKVLGAAKLSKADMDLMTGRNRPGDFLTAVYTPAELARIDAILARLHPLWAQIDEAGRRPGAYWPELFFSKPSDPGIQALEQARSMFIILAMQSRRAHVRGDDAAALRAVHRMLIVSSITDTRTNLLCHLIAVGIRAGAAQCFLKLLPALHLNAQVISEGNRLSALMQDDDAFNAAKVRAVQEEATGGLRLLTKLLPSAYSLEGLLNPLTLDGLAQRLHGSILLRPSLEASTFPETRRLEPPAYTPTYSPDAPLDAVAWLGSSELAVTYYRPVLMHDRALADAHAAATLWALRLYHDAHHRYPAALGDLVPAYLDKLPRDVFAPGDVALRYRVDAVGATVWSVGENGVDDGGKPVLFHGAVSRYNSADYIYGAAWRAFEAAHSGASAP